MGWSFTALTYENKAAKAGELFNPAA